MIVNTNHYARLFYPGGFFGADTIDRHVGSRDPKTVEPECPCKTRCADHDRKPYAFQFFDKTEAIMQDGEVLSGMPRNFSGMFFFSGEIFDIERVRRELAGHPSLLANMESNRWRRVVKTAQGYLPMSDDDQVLS